MTSAVEGECGGAFYKERTDIFDQTAEALTYFGNRAMEQGNDALARWLYEEGLAIWRALDFQPGIAHLIERLEWLAYRQKERPDEALTDRRRGYAKPSSTYRSARRGR